MKKDTHPDYQQVVFADITTDFKVLTRSTVSTTDTIEWEDGKTYPLVRVEISSASHPFYTGKRQNIADRGGRIEQFRKRYGAEAAEITAEAGEVQADPSQADPVQAPEEAQQADS
jgi:large subunit ribosomal protein L31